MWESGNRFIDESQILALDFGGGLTGALVVREEKLREDKQGRDGVRFLTLEGGRTRGSQKSQRTVLGLQGAQRSDEPLVPRTDMYHRVRSPVMAREAVGGGASTKPPRLMIAQSLFDRLLERFRIVVPRPESSYQQSRADNDFVPLHPRVHQPVRFRQTLAPSRLVNETLPAQLVDAIGGRRRADSRFGRQDSNGLVHKVRPREQREIDLEPGSTHAAPVTRAWLGRAAFYLRDVLAADFQATIARRVHEVRTVLVQESAERAPDMRGKEYPGAASESGRLGENPLHDRTSQVSPLDFDDKDLGLAGCLDSDFTIESPARLAALPLDERGFIDERQLAQAVEASLQEVILMSRHVRNNTISITNRQVESLGRVVPSAGGRTCRRLTMEPVNRALQISLGLAEL